VKSRIDHVAIAVKDLKKASDFFRKLFDTVPCSTETDPRMKYTWQVFSLGDLSRLELVTPAGDGSFLDNFLKDRDGGVHHITIQTPDIYKARDVLEDNGVPFFGFNDGNPIWKELFIHPKDAFGVLIQIAEFIPDDWLSGPVKLPEGVKWLAEKKHDHHSLSISHPGGGTARIDLNETELIKLIADLESLL